MEVLKKINWRCGLNRVYILLLVLYYGNCFLLGPIINGDNIRKKAGNLIGIEYFEFKVKRYKEASFPNQFKELIQRLTEQPIVAAFVLIGVPILLYIIPLVFIKIIRWVLGFKYSDYYK